MRDLMLKIREQFQRVPRRSGRMRARIGAMALVAMALISCGGSEDAPMAVDAMRSAPEQLTVAEPTATDEFVPTPLPQASAEPTAGAGSGVSEAPSTPAEGHDAPGDLVVPDPLEAGEPGELIATEDIVIGRPGGSPLDGHRVLYHSQSVAGNDIAVSGFVIRPSGSPPEGGWPLVAWAHGTTGIGDACAPSDVVNHLNNYPAIRLAEEGFVVIATDYEGLGTPGRHPYSVGASQARSVLDSVRAVHNMELPVTDEWIAFGFSQGGQAALFTAQLQPSYAPELELIGTIAASPGSQRPNSVATWTAGNDHARSVMAAVGLAAAFPEFDLAAILTPEAMDRLDIIDTGCVAQIDEVFNASPWEDLFKPFPWEDMARQIDGLVVGPFVDQFMEQNTNRLPTRQPLLIIHGDADEEVPVETSALLLDQLCAFEGQAPATRNVYPGAPHGGAIYGNDGWPDLLEWAEARFADKPAPDDCQR